MRGSCERFLNPGIIAQPVASMKPRGTRIIDANGLIVAAAKAGMLQRDGIHLTAAGNQRVAAGLMGSLR